MRADRVSLLLTYAMAVIGMVPTVLDVSPVYTLLLAAFTAVGLRWDLTDRHSISPWALNLLVIVGMLVALALPSASGVVGRLLAASVVLMGGKLLAPKATRDMLQVMLLSLLLLIGSAILSTSMAFALLFGAYLVLSTFTLLWLPFGSEMQRQAISRGMAARIAGVAIVIVGGSIPLVLLFFLALPRTPVPLWRGGAVGTQVSGFSNHVSLGDVSRIALDSGVAFRAELPGRTGPLKDPPYWRGLVLEETDGFTWTIRSPVALEDAPRPLQTGDAALVAQRVYLEPHGDVALFGLDRVMVARSSSMPLANIEEGALSASRPVVRRMTYDVESDPSPYLAERPSALALQADLELPSGLPPIVAATARRVVNGESDPHRKVVLLLDHLQSGGYRYSLEVPAGEGHPLDVFLTQTKTGYCEHFASAMALMLRSVGVPARMVAGYLGGDYNRAGGYYLVRQLHAHAWVEAYIEGAGWLRVDPTPPGQGPGSPSAVPPPSSAFMALDWVRLKWQALVLGYDLDRQGVLIGSVTAALVRPFQWRPDTGRPGDLMVILLMVAAVTAATLLWRRGGHDDAEAVLYATLLRRLRRRGLRRSIAEGPLDFAERAEQTLPARSDAIHELTLCYLDARYGSKRRSRDELRRLRRLARRL